MGTDGGERLTPRVRIRKNLYGRDRRRPRRAQWKRTLPLVIQLACERFSRIKLPLLLGRARRSELTETARLVGPTMMARTDLASGRIGRPDRNNPRRFVGLSIDHDLAPLSDDGESKIERFMGSLKDWDWLHWRALPTGRRKAKRGFLRCSAQPIERKPSGERRGRAAVRVWTDEVFRYLGLWPALCEARQQLARSAAKQTAVRRLPVASMVAQLADAHTLTDPRERPPP